MQCCKRLLSICCVFGPGLFVSKLYIFFNWLYAFMLWKRRGVCGASFLICEVCCPGIATSPCCEAQWAEMCARNTWVTWDGLWETKGAKGKTFAMIRIYIYISYIYVYTVVLGMTVQLNFPVWSCWAVISASFSSFPWKLGRRGKHGLVEGER